MASLKGGTSLWSNATVGVAGGATAKSAIGAIGPGPWVTVYIENPSAVSLTFKVQVAGVANPVAGRNAVDGTVDGGLVWHDFTSSSGAAETTITVAAGANIAIDLSPFSPELMRLIRTDAGAQVTGITAFVTCFGAN